MARNRSRMILTIAAVSIIGAALTFAFWPRPMMVDIGEVKIGSMVVTIDEEGRTRVHDAYVVSTPVAGRLLRVDVEPGDSVVRGESIVAQMLPTNPSLLDVRTREQARATVAAAKAGLRVARADLNKAIADRELADAELERANSLRESRTVSQARLDRVIQEKRAAHASLDNAEAAVSMREAEVNNAQARLISFDSQEVASGTGDIPEKAIPVYSPATGRVLRVMQQSETTLSVGAPIMEIGNVESDLEVLVELLSTDAVQVAPGNRVMIEDWGSSEALRGVVERVDPLGFTKVSALGVEEQRVNTVIRFADPQPKTARLGHGFRIEARIVVWEDDDALVVPSSALFRDGPNWAVFVVKDGVASLRHIKTGRNNGIQAQVLEGLERGDRVILYPSSGIVEGSSVAQREIG